MELKEARIRIRALEDFVSANERQQKLLEDAYQMRLDAAAAMLAARTKERDLAAEKAKFYEDAYRAATKKRSGFGCKLKRIFTFGIARPCK